MAMSIIMNMLGKGKTTFLAWVGMVEYLRGRTIFSNFHLEFPHVRVRSVGDLGKLRDGVLLIDDAYLWFYTPVVGTNPMVSKIMAFSRKRKVDIYYTITRSNQIHVNLRSCTQYAYIPLLLKFSDMIICQRYIFLGDREKVGDDDRMGQPMGCYIVRNIQYIWSQFNTEEEVEDLVGMEAGKIRTHR